MSPTRARTRTAQAHCKSSLIFFFSQEVGGRWWVGRSSNIFGHLARGDTCTWCVTVILQGPDGETAYLALQGPLPKTVNDFWRLIASHRCQVMKMYSCGRFGGLMDSRSSGYWPSDRVQEKNENCALFWRRIVRDKKLIVRVIVRDCAILRRTKYFVSHSLLK